MDKSFEKDYSDIIKRLGNLKTSVLPSEKLKFHLQKVLLPTLPSKPPISWSIFSIRLALATLAMILLGGTGLAFAAEKSNPGDILYPVKMAAEKAQIALTQNSTAKAMLHIVNADKRITEMKSSLEKGNAADLNNLSVNYETNVDSAIKELKKVSSQEEKVVKTINNHLEKDTQELQEVQQLAPTTAQPAIQKAIDASQKGHDETEKVLPTQPAATPTTGVSRQSQSEQERQNQENSSVQGASDVNKKVNSDNNSLKESPEKGGD